MAGPVRWFRFSLFAPALAFLAAMTLAPFAWVLWASVHQVRLGAPVAYLGGAQYRAVLADPYVWLALRNTAGLTVAAVAMELAAGVGLALLFRRTLPGSAALRFVILVPMTLSPLLVGLFWKYMLDQEFGIVTWALGLISGERPSLLTTPGRALASILLVDVWQWTPFVFLLCTAALRGLPPEIEEAAVLENAGAWRRTRDLVLPHLKGALVLAALFRGIDTMKIFDLVYILTGGGPGDATLTLSVLTYRTGFSWFDLGRASALSILLLLIVNLMATAAIRATAAPREARA
jgi:multiple sugar transport system permease protein